MEAGARRYLIDQQIRREQQESENAARLESEMKQKAWEQKMEERERFEREEKERERRHQEILDTIKKDY